MVHICIFSILYLLFSNTCVGKALSSPTKSCRNRTMTHDTTYIYSILCKTAVSSILGRLLLVPVGNTGTIPYEMRRESATFEGVFGDKTKDSTDGCRWYYVNSWGLSCRTKQ